MKVAIFHYASFLKGAYSTVEVAPTTTLGEIATTWRTYFKNPNLKVFKFKLNCWADAYTGNYQNSFFDDSTTIQQYVDFYGQSMVSFPHVIFL